jgi:ubiquitin fusion degradation protein 1
MLFELNNDPKATTTHAGVLEFIAEEGRVYAPQWVFYLFIHAPDDAISCASTG